MDREHKTLAELLACADRLCGAEEPDPRCENCRNELSTRCCRELQSLGDRLMSVFIDHCHREDELMALLPNSPASHRHRMAHRNEHSDFFRKYNQAVLNLDKHDTAIGTRRLRTLLVDWIREHALRYDAELAELLDEVGEGEKAASAA